MVEVTLESTAEIRAAIRPLSASSVTLSLEPVPDLAALAALWLDLERRAEPSFFLSWTWIGCWVRALPPEVKPWLLTVRDGSFVVGLALLVSRRCRRLALLPMHRWWLHETGDPLLDILTIEDNGILLSRDRGIDLPPVILRWLLENLPDCDEMILGGIVPELELAAQRAASGAGFTPRLLSETVRPYVDLDAVRAQGHPAENFKGLSGDDNYLAQLSRGTRQAVRRAVRLYEASGPLRFSVAGDSDEALDYFGRMKLLHQAHWGGRGKPGSFAAPAFERFHSQLIRDGVAAGSVEVCRISAGDREIGYLYNFIWNGWVHAYQSGFAYDEDNRLKPGLVSHYLAIRHALEDGRQIYDFMAGDGQHKRSLSTHATRMAWLALTADGLPRKIEDTLRRVKRCILRPSKRA